MTEEVSVERAVRRPKRNYRTAFSLFVLLFALLGVIVAAFSEAPILWMLVWPTPLVLIFTAARFIREGVHRRDGVLVFGRREAGADEANNFGADDMKVESHDVEKNTESIPEPASAPIRRENVETGTTHGFAVHPHTRQNQRRSWRYNVPYVLEKGTVN